MLKRELAHGCVLFCLALWLTAARCCAFGDYFYSNIQIHGSEVTIANNDTTRRKGYVTQIDLSWHPVGSSSIPPKLNVIWLARANKKVSVAGFRFKAFVLPPNFRLDGDKSGQLPETGYYILTIHSTDRIESLLTVIKPSEVLKWKSNSLTSK